MRIERIVNYIETLGPGKRLCIWVNGCNRRCKGCVSERLQAIDYGTEIPIEESLKNYDFTAVDGVTISGGEPFDQAEELLHLVTYLKAKEIDDILVYSGYTVEELNGNPNGNIAEVLQKIAVLIDGPYVKELDNGKGNLAGSSNQRVIFMNEKYRADYQKFYSEERRMQEMILYDTVLAAGIPDEKYIEEFLKNQI